MMIVYKTKASLLIKLLFATALLVLLVVALVEKSIALFAVTLGFGVFTVYIFYNTHYTIFENILTIKSGFLFTESIDIESIRKVTRRRRHLLSGPGFSVDRLMVEYNKHDCVIIAPRLREAFVRHLKKINPDIQYKEQ
ncbi:MAG TPA: PH domain-containing protein [Niabella sp.]|nr:PH domain-containing protein [Niabella sp.]